MHVKQEWLNCSQPLKTCVSQFRERYGGHVFRAFFDCVFCRMTAPCAGQARCKVFVERQHGPQSQGKVAWRRGKDGWRERVGSKGETICCKRQVKVLVSKPKETIVV